jgi:hypothetical protein
MGLKRIAQCPWNKLVSMMADARVRFKTDSDGFQPGVIVK